MDNPRTYGPSETIGDWNYFQAADGDLYRARTNSSPEARRVELVVPASKAKFALRCMRIGAGLPEHGSEQASGA